nr:unnamed protein product [Digitaria exilis]
MVLSIDTEWFIPGGAGDESSRGSAACGDSMPTMITTEGIATNTNGIEIMVSFRSRSPGAV